MNPRSIRFQLTLWYATALFLCLTVVLGLFYWLTRQALFSQTDQTLIAHGKPIVNLVSTADCCLTKEQATTHQVLLKTLSSMPGMMVVIQAADGEIISSSLDTQVYATTFQSIFNQYNRAFQPVLTNQFIGDTQIRFWVVPILQDQVFGGMVMVGHPIDNIQQSLTSLSLTLGITFVLLVIPTLAGGYFLAQRAMSPIGAIDTQMKQISSTNLTHRVINPQTGDELEGLAHTFNQLLDRLSTAFERERQLIGDLAHELKTPLAILRSTAELVLTKPRQVGAYQEALKEVIEDADRLGSILQQILDLAWSKTEQTQLTDQKCHLSAILLELQEVVTKLAKIKQIQIQIAIAPHLWVLGNDDKLAQAFLNIIENAIKYTPRKGAVRISLRANKKTVLLKVKDTGRGIAKADLPQVFERFHRGSKTMQTIGSGLGLAIASATVKAHSGQINLKSTVGKGTTVTIRLPLIRTTA